MPTQTMLACVEPFCGARPLELETLAGTVTRVHKPAGSVLLREGQTPDGLYVLLRGRVNLVRQGDAGRDLILCSLGAGEVAGEAAALHGATTSTTAICAVTSELARIPGDALIEHMRREPTTLVRVVRLIGDRLREVESVASGLALCDVEERLRQTLARLALRQGRRAPSTAAGQGGWILAPVPTQSELARMVGSCRETVSRTLSVMSRNGLLQASGRRMILHESMMSEALA
jgi:CRP-like cAMP-binding protein